MSAEPRKGFAGTYTLTISADQAGVLTMYGKGNLSVQEVLLGVEVFKAQLLRGAQMTGRATVPGFEPKRF
jgi:hypothetical protein